MSVKHDGMCHKHLQADKDRDPRQRLGDRVAISTYICPVVLNKHNIFDDDIL